MKQQIIRNVNKQGNKKLKKQTKNVILPQYILNCFQSFCANKKQISLDMALLHQDGNENINNLIFYSLVKRVWNKEFKPNDDDLSNVVHSDLLALFPNVTSLTIDTWRGFIFRFSLMALLNVIFGTNLKEIIIKSEETRYGFCWIKSIWNSDKEILKKEYAAKGYEIAMEHAYDHQYNLKINKL